jgi:hypothetical protein
LSEGGAQSSSIVGPPVPLCRHLCAVGDNTDYCTPDSSWSVRGVLEAMSWYHGNATLMHDALRILCHVARGPDVRLVEGEDMTIAIPALTAVFQGTLVERLGRSERMAGDDGALALVLLGDAAKFGGAPTARAFLQAGTTPMAVDLLKGVHDTVLEEVEEAYACAAWILAAACEHAGDDAAPLKALLEAGAVDAVARKSHRVTSRQAPCVHFLLVADCLWACHYHCYPSSHAHGSRWGGGVIVLAVACGCGDCYHNCWDALCSAPTFRCLHVVPAKGRVLWATLACEDHRRSQQSGIAARTLAAGHPGSIRGEANVSKPIHCSRRGGCWPALLGETCGVDRLRPLNRTSHGPREWARACRAGPARCPGETITAVAHVFLCMLRPHSQEHRVSLSSKYKIGL